MLTVIRIWAKALVAFKSTLVSEIRTRNVSKAGMKTHWNCLSPTLTAFNILAVSVLAGQATGFVAQGVQLTLGKFWLVLEAAETSVFAMTAQMPVFGQRSFLFLPLSLRVD